MSVINQMLRDLDAREASSQERAGLPPRLRPLPKGRPSRFKPWHMLVLGLGIGGVVAGFVASIYFSGRVPDVALPLQATVPAAPVAPPKLAVAAEPAPVSSAAEPPPLAVPDPVAVAIAEPPVPLSAPNDGREMKLATQLASQKTAPAQGQMAGTGKSASVPKEPKAAPVQKPVAAQSEPVVADAQIDKRSTGGQAREMAEAEYRKGMQAVKRGETAAAVPLLQRVLELDPLHAKARQTLLSVLVSGKQWTEALRVAQAGLALEPHQTGWAAILARLQFDQGDSQAALETLARHAAHAGNDADYQGLFAYLLQKQQRFAEAAQHFQAALALRPQEGRWWFGLGVALESAGRQAEARDAYAKARDAGNLPADMASVVEQKLR